MSRKFITTIVAGAIAVTGFTAASQAQASDRDLARFLAGATALIIIGSALSDNGKRRQVATHGHGHGHAHKKIYRQPTAWELREQARREQARREALRRERLEAQRRAERRAEREAERRAERRADRRDDRRAERHREHIHGLAPRPLPDRVKRYKHYHDR